MYAMLALAAGVPTAMANGEFLVQGLFMWIGVSLGLIHEPDILVPALLSAGCAFGFAAWVALSAFHLWGGRYWLRRAPVGLWYALGAGVASVSGIGVLSLAASFEWGGAAASYLGAWPGVEGPILLRGPVVLPLAGFLAWAAWWPGAHAGQDVSR